MVVNHILIFYEGDIETLKRNVTKCKGMTIVDLSEDNYDFLYNTVIETANEQARA